MSCKWECFSRLSSANKSFWEREKAVLNELTPDASERRIFVDMIETFWECQGHNFRTLSPDSTEWSNEIQKRLSDYVDYEDKTLPIICEGKTSLSLQKTISSSILKLVEMTERQDVSTDAWRVDSKFRDNVREYWEGRHILWLVYSQRWHSWRDAFRHMVDEIFDLLQRKLEKAQMNEELGRSGIAFEQTRASWDTLRNDLLTKLFKARTWKVAVQDLLDDYLDFPKVPCTSCLKHKCPGSDHSKDDVLEKFLGKPWDACRQRLLKETQDCSSWEAVFSSLQESATLCIKATMDEKYYNILQYKIQSDKVMQKAPIDGTNDHWALTCAIVAEYMRLRSQKSQGSSDLPEVDHYFDFLKLKMDSLTIIYGQSSEPFFNLTLKYCRHEQINIAAPTPNPNATRAPLKIAQLPPLPSQNNDLPDVEIETIQIDSNEKLLLRTKLDNRGKTVVFTDIREDPAFKGSISVHFPEFSVLAEEKISLEIVPESIVEMYNNNISAARETIRKKSKLESDNADAGNIDKKLITPILHIDRENDAPFLRTVTVILPVLSNVVNNLKGYEIGTPDRISFSEESKSFKISCVKFSPVGIAEIRGILRPLKIDSDMSYAFDELGIYFLCEQFQHRHFKMDLRRFVNWQEHRRFRMDESKYLLLVISPQKVQHGDHGTKVEAILRDPIAVSNDQESDKIQEFGQGNKVVFFFPNPEHPPDCTNVRNMTLNSINESPLNTFLIKFGYETTNLKRFGASELQHIPFICEERIEFIRNTRVDNTEQIMGRVLELLGDNWLEFLERYLQLDINGLYEFLSKDIRDTFPPENLSWVPENVRRLKNACNRREFHLTQASQNSGDVIEEIFSNFRTKLELKTAKREIRMMLEDCFIIPKYGDFTDKLLKRNREIVAAALMYIPMEKMKQSIRDAFEANLLCINHTVQKFIHDGICFGDTLQ